MRIVVVVFAALLTLGLVGFGVIVAQKDTDPVPLTAAAAGVSSPPALSDKESIDLAAVKAAPFTSTAVAENNTMAVSAFPVYSRRQRRHLLRATSPMRSATRESLRSIR